MGIDDYMDESENDSIDVAQDTLRNVLSKMTNKKATYPSEISAQTSLSENKAGSLLIQLKEVGVVEKVTPTFTAPDPRSVDASNRTMTNSIKMMRKKKWYALNSDLDWYIATDEGKIVDEKLIPYPNQEVARKLKEKSQNPVNFARKRLEEA